MHFENARDVITALGGLEAVSLLTGRKYGTVSAWQTRFNSFPPELYVIMTEALEKIGASAPMSLWRQIEPVTADEGEDEAQEETV
jgi:hypothetical protein